MVDHISPERRSWLMSRVKGKNTSPEIRVRRLAHGMGLRFRLHRKDLPGKPDLVFPRYGVALFVHGCFWHRHPNCPKASIPKTNIAFWLKKFRQNVERDTRAIKALEKLGWSVKIVWECETKDIDRLGTLISSLVEADLDAGAEGAEVVKSENNENQAGD